MQNEIYSQRKEICRKCIENLRKENAEKNKKQHKYLKNHNYIHKWNCQDDIEWSCGLVPCFYGILGIDKEPHSKCPFKLEILLLQKKLAISDE